MVPLVALVACCLLKTGDVEVEDKDEGEDEDGEQEADEDENVFEVQAKLMVLSSGACISHSGCCARTSEGCCWPMVGSLDTAIEAC